MKIQSLRVFVLFVVVLVLLALPSLAFAQSEVPTGTSPAEGELVAALDILLKGLSNIIFLPAAIPFVTAVTGLLKQWIPINPSYIALTTQVVVWVVWILLKHAGYADQFEGWIGAITTLITTVAALAVSIWGSTKLYNSGKKNDAPLIGTTQSAAKDVSS